MEINVNSYIPVTNVEGFGKRFAIWVQGCSLRCDGCANSHMWNNNNGKSYKIEKILDLIKIYINEIEGITFLGGEPLEQIEAITCISKIVQQLGLSVIVFTGYEYRYLKNNIKFQELSNYIDVLIDGRYEKSKQDFSRPWIGSSNQNYYFLSKKYNASMLEQYKNKIEIRISPDGKIAITGMGDFSQLTSAV